jgi:hypothetical protein
MLNEKEYSHFTRLVERSGMTKSKILRSMIMGTTIKDRLPKEYHDTYRLVANMSNNLNQIARVVNSTHSIHTEQVDTLTQIMDKCWNHFKGLR